MSRRTQNKSINRDQPRAGLCRAIIVILSSFVAIAAGSHVYTSVSLDKPEVLGTQRARTAFWKTMKWIMPVFLAIALSLYVYMLSTLTGPIAKLSAENEHMGQELADLHRELVRLRCKQTDSKEQIARLDERVQHLQDGRPANANGSEDN